MQRHWDEHIHAVQFRITCKGRGKQRTKETIQLLPSCEFEYEYQSSQAPSVLTHTNRA